MGIILSEDDLRKITAFVEKIDISNPILVENFGLKYQTDLSEVVNIISQISERINPNDVQSIIDKILEILQDYNKLDSSLLNFSLNKQYHYLKTKKLLDPLKSELDSACLDLSAEIADLSKAYKDLNKICRFITMYIEAGEKRLSLANMEISENNKLVSIIEAETLEKKQQYIRRFSSKLDSLRLSLTTGLQLMATVNMRLETLRNKKQIANSLLNGTLNAFYTNHILRKQP